MKKMILVFIVILFAVSAIAIISKRGSGASSNKNTASVSPAAEDAPLYVASEGKVEAIPGFEVEVGSETDGKIAEFFVEEGSHVKKGETIARMENSDIQAKLKETEAEVSVSRSKLKEVASGAREEEIRSAEAVLEGAVAGGKYEKETFERYGELFKEGNASKELLDLKEKETKTSEALIKKAEEEKKLLEKGPKKETIRLLEDAVKKAEAVVEYYKALLDRTYIKAPISGKVIRKYLHGGEMTSRDIQPCIVAIANLDKTRINADVDETDIGKIRIGDPAEITSYAYPGTIFKGGVEDISDYAGVRKVVPNNAAKNRDMKIVQVKIRFMEKTPLKLGMTVDVRIMPREGSRASSWKRIREITTERLPG